MTLSLKKYIGDRAFYKMLFLISIPIMLQNALTSIVGLLDNVMVGQLGTNDMTGVSVANNLLFVYLIVCFGSVSGAGIFSAQYFGKKDFKGMASAFRMKIYIFLVVTILSIGISFRSCLGLPVRDAVRSSVPRTVDVLFLDYEGERKHVPADDHGNHICSYRPGIQLPSHIR